MSKRWSFTWQCKKQQISHQEFIGNETARHDLYALAKTKYKNKARNRWKERMRAAGKKPSWDGSKKTP